MASFSDNLAGVFSGDWFSNFTTFGLDSSNDATVIHVPGLPVQPSSAMTDEDIKAWRLQNVGAFAVGGETVAADGSVTKTSGYDWTKAPGAIVPDASFGAALKSEIGIGTPGTYKPGAIDSVTNTVKAVAIGIGVLLALAIVLEVAKR